MDKDFIRVFQTPPMNNANPVYPPQRVSMQTICNADLNLPIKVSVYCYRDHGDHDLYGFFITSVGDL